MGLPGRRVGRATRPRSPRRHVRAVREGSRVIWAPCVFLGVFALRYKRRVLLLSLSAIAGAVGGVLGARGFLARLRGESHNAKSKGWEGTGILRT